MRVMDFRFRPPYKSFLQSFLWEDIDGMEILSKKFGVAISEAIREKSMEMVIREMDAANVTKAVVPVQIRQICTGNNNDLISLTAEYPDRFIGIAGLDPLAGEEALQQIDKYVVKGNCHGVIIEPAMISEPIYVTDERVYPIYEKCQRENIPLLITFGGLRMAGLKYYDPTTVDQIARIFPNLKIALCHGGWPYVNEICQVAIENRNVYLSQDCYLINSPGCKDYVTAANYLLQDKMFFGTAYPVMGLQEGIDAYKASGLKEEIWHKIFYDNGAKFLGLELGGEWIGN